LIPRIIPVLLLDGEDAVKTVRFASPRYVGDIVNTVQIFNEKMVSELVVLDISGKRNGQSPSPVLRSLAEECFMPLGYGGGINSLDQMSAYYAAGFEKLSLNTAFHTVSGLVSQAAARYGSQSVVVGIDVRKSPQGKNEVFIHNGRKSTGLDPVTVAKRAEAEGAGEILLQSIDRDGTFEGYELALVESVSAAVGIPVVACGGAATTRHLREVQAQAGASAAAAGSMFVFHGVHRAVLVTYPDENSIQALAQ
jgi:imidazole glycerol-phosphate synthase subunit HisF